MIHVVLSFFPPTIGCITFVLYRVSCDVFFFFFTERDPSKVREEGGWQVIRIRAPPY